MTHHALARGFFFVVLCLTARAQTLVYTGFNSTAGLSLNDAVVNASGGITLASNALDRRGSFFTVDAQQVASGFSLVFQFRIQSPGGANDGVAAGADGLALVLQRQAPTALGGTGEALGYGARGSVAGISPSVAVEFDTFRNTWDPSTNHIGINTGGNLTSLQAVNIPTAFDGGQVWTAWVDYDGTELAVRTSATGGARPLVADLSYSMDLLATLGGTSAFIGFTGATGSGFGNHEVLGFAFSDTFLAGGIAAVPEPSTYALIALGAGLLWLGRRRWRV